MTWRWKDGSKIGQRLHDRLMLDFDVVQPADCPLHPAVFFVSPGFRQRALDWMVVYLLQRAAMAGEPASGPLPDGSFADLLDMCASIIASEEFFVEQAGGNALLFLTRLSYQLPFVEAFLPDGTADLSAPQGRMELIRRILGIPQVRQSIIALTYDALGLPSPDAATMQRLANAEDWFLENVLVSATSEPGYLVGALRGKRTFEIYRSRLYRNLSRLFPRRSSCTRAELSRISLEAIHGAMPIQTFTRLTSMFATGLTSEQRAEAVLGRKADHPGLTLRTLVAGRGTSHEAAHLERDYRAQAKIEAARIVRYWLDTFALRSMVDRQSVLDLWVQRLLENDATVEVFVRFLLSDVCLGIDLAALRAIPNLSAPPGSNLGLQARGPDLDRIVTTSFFYWYDDIDGQALIACPDTMINVSGADSLTVAPLDRTNFTYQSLDWHRSELIDMARASINVVLPVSLLHPFSCDELNFPQGGKSKRLAFANAGLRALRAAWLSLANEGQSPPHIGLFYDTSTLNADNRFGLKVDFRRRYAKTWFYESIRDFFSYLPQRMWARHDGLPIVFVYHPCFGDFVDDSLFDFVRQRFRDDFETDLYIITAAEEEAPRVLQAPQLVGDAEALSSGRGLDVLAGILAKDDLYASALRNDAAFSQLVLRRTLRSSLPIDQATARYFTGGFADPEVRRSFVGSIVYSSDFRWSVLHDWFLRLLRTKLDMSDPVHAELVEGATEELRRGDWLEALSILVASDLFDAAAGGTPGYFADWLYQSIILKHPNELCTQQFGSLHADGQGKQELLSALTQGSRRDAVRTFLQRYEVREAIVSCWYHYYFGWYYPGVANSSFYWTAAISPTIKGVASIGPGYDQSKLRHRPTLCMPRCDGTTYENVWTWILAMKPRPKIVHIETWNEFFEGTVICASREYGYQYVDLTQRFGSEFLRGEDGPDGT